MKNVKPELIGKSLENERDISINLNSTLFNDALKKQLNIFYSIYILSISDKNDSLETLDTLKLYRNFYATKFNGVRFLFELFLTSLEVMSQKNDQEKNELVFSLALSERINFHSMNKGILALDPSKIDYISAVKNDKQGYINFLNKYSKISPLIPDDIEVFFLVDNLTLLINQKGKEFKEKFGFKYYRYNKLNYGNIMENNKKLKILIEKIREASIFSPTITSGFLRKIYSGVSNESHPTFSTIEDFDKFISKDEKEKTDLIFNARNNYDAFLKVIGVLMDVLYKESRDKEIENLNYIA